MKIILCPLLLVIFAACSSSKSVSQIRAEANSEEVLYTALVSKIDALDKKRSEKVQSGELDETTDSITKVYLTQLKDSVDFRLHYFNALISNKKIRKNRQNIIAYLNATENDYSIDLQNVYVLDDLFGASTFSRLNTAAFFGPGEYALSDSTTTEADSVMYTVSKQALDFSANHHSSKLKAMFIVLGYADEQDITTGSGLYNDLIKNFPDSNATRKQLNTELSNRRAHSINTILKREYDTLAPTYQGNLNTSFMATGKGEQLPPGNKTDYQPIDPARRVVLVYWSILPDLNVK